MSDNTDVEAPAAEELEGLEEQTGEQTEAEGIEDGETVIKSGEAESEGEEEEYVTIDGEDITLDQIKELKLGQLRESDYTRKSQALAEQRRATETLATDLSDSIKVIEQMIEEDESSDDLEQLLDDDPSEYLRREKKLKAKRSRLKSAKKALSEANKTKTAEESQALINIMSTEWADKKVQDRDIKLCMEYAGKIGFGNDDLSKISDHRVYKALIDASKYEQLKTNKPAVKKRKVSAIKKTSKQNAPVQKNETKTLGQLLYGAS